MLEQSLICTGVRKVGIYRYQERTVATTMSGVR
jgi:hypothetical protein